MKSMSSEQQEEFSQKFLMCKINALQRCHAHNVLILKFIKQKAASWVMYLIFLQIDPNVLNL